MLPVDTGIPYGPVPDSYFSGSSLQTSHAQIPAPQTIQPNGSFEDQLGSILREFGLEPKGKAPAHEKPYQIISTRHHILVVSKFQILLNLQGK